MTSIARALNISACGVLSLLCGAYHASAQVPLGKLLPEQQNSPGLRCWGVRGGLSGQAYVFEAPSTSAPRTLRIQSWAAVTGPAIDGFLPVMTSSGRRGWVMEEAVVKDRFGTLYCVARYLSDGRPDLIYGPTRARSGRS